jgi:hypothetical protein
MHFRRFVLACVGFAILSGSASAAVVLSGANGSVTTMPDGTQVLIAPNPLPPDPLGLPQNSDGSLGPLTIATDAVIALPAGGVFNLTSLSIAAGARLSFSGGDASTAISLLMTEPSVIDGIVDARNFAALSFYGPQIAFGPTAEILTGSGSLLLNVTMTAVSFPPPDTIVVVTPPNFVVGNILPEPSSLLLLGVGGMLLLGLGRRPRAGA